MFRILFVIVTILLAVLPNGMTQESDSTCKNFLKGLAEKINPPPEKDWPGLDFWDSNSQEIKPEDITITIDSRLQTFILAEPIELALKNVILSDNKQSDNKELSKKPFITLDLFREGYQKESVDVNVKLTLVEDQISDVELTLVEDQISDVEKTVVEDQTPKNNAVNQFALKQAEEFLRRSLFWEVFVTKVLTEDYIDCNYDDKLKSYRGMLAGYQLSIGTSVGEEETIRIFFDKKPSEGGKVKGFYTTSSLVVINSYEVSKENISFYGERFSLDTKEPLFEVDEFTSLKIEIKTNTKTE